MADDGGGGGASEGPATDRHNEPVRDPTENVRELVLAEAKYQSAMRTMSDRHLKETLDRDRKYIERMLDMRAESARLQFEREREHNQEVRTMESSRIDAIRQVDVAAVQQAANTQATAATTLAGQVAAAAEAMRTANAAATASFTTALATAIAPLNDAIADLRRAQYEQQGRSANTVETKTDQRGGMSIAIAVAGVSLGVLSLIASIVFALLR